MHPQSIAIDANDNIYVVDRENDRIQVFHADGKHFLTIGKKWNRKYYWIPVGRGPYYLRNPYGIAVDKDSIYVTDWAKHRVLHYNLDGQYIGEWGEETKQHPALYYPRGIYIDGKGRIHVSHDRKDTSENGNPMIFDRDGKFLGYSKLPGGCGFAESPDGTSFQTYQSRVYKMDKDGNLSGWIGRAHLPSDNSVEKAGSWIPASQTYPNGEKGGWWCVAGSGKSEFKNPVALAIDPDRKILFVCDMMNHRIQIFDLNGKYIGEIGARGKEKGQFLCPSGIALDSKGNVYVVDKYNNRIQVFSPKK